MEVIMDHSRSESSQMDPIPSSQDHASEPHAERKRSPGPLPFVFRRLSRKIKNLVVRFLRTGRKVPTTTHERTLDESHHSLAASPSSGEFESQTKTHLSVTLSPLSRTSINCQVGGHEQTCAPSPFRIPHHQDPIIEPSPVSSGCDISRQANRQSPAVTNAGLLNIDPPQSSSLPPSPIQPGHSEPMPAATHWVYSIKARLSEKKNREEVFRASLDTQCKGPGLLSYDAWKRLNEHYRKALKPCPGTVVRPLQSDPSATSQIQVIGETGEVRWHFLRGPRTFISKFLVIDMEKYDMIIGQQTIQKYKLLEAGVELPPFDRFEVRKTPTSVEIETTHEPSEEP